MTDRAKLTRQDSGDFKLRQREPRTSEMKVDDSTIKDIELRKLFLNMDRKLKIIDTNEKLKEIETINKPIIEQEINESLSNISPTLVKSFNQIFMQILKNINTYYSELINAQNIELTSIISEKNLWEQKHYLLERKLNKLNKLKSESSAPTVLVNRIPRANKFSTAKGKRKREGTKKKKN